MNTNPISSSRVLIRGGGDLGTGVAHRLFRCGFPVVVSELPQPMMVRRKVSFGSAVYEGQIIVEGVQARLVSLRSEIEQLLKQGHVPVVIDPRGELLAWLLPEVVIDARLAKRNLGTHVTDAPVVIGLGPGLVAGQDVHAVVETNRGHYLGRVILSGGAQPDTGVPGVVEGFARERVLWAPCGGRFRTEAEIGQQVRRGQTIAEVSGRPVSATISGVLRGLLHDDLPVEAGQKVGDIDPRGVTEYCFTLSDKARAIAGGVLEAILYLQHLTAPDANDAST
jgi:xanthine dehydrogenase accessory factor